MKPLILIFVLILISCSGDTHRKRIFFRMDTVVEITISVPVAFNPAALWRSVDSLLLDYETRFSASGEASEVRALNDRASRSLAVSPKLSEMLRTALAWGDSLDGAFDVTVLPLKKLWGLCEECAGDEPLPDSPQVAAALRAVGYKKIRVSAGGDSVYFESPDTRVDVGGIAKGFALRGLAALLKDGGVDNFIIAAGGDILASGRKRDGAAWRVGIRHPRNAGELVTTMPLDSGAVVTSGDYERFRTADGKRYHHIFDPSTGYSCDANQSLTIWAPDPVVADILSTGLFCRSAEDIIEYVREKDGVHCFVVDSGGVVKKRF